jgi:activated CDC42 kinase 1
VGGKSWGNPSFIDEVYLRNPMEPPDVLGMAQDPGPAPKLPDRKKSELLFICIWYFYFSMKY